MYYMGFTYFEAYAIPIWQRRWFIERLNKEIKRSNEQGNAQSRAAHSNSPESRALMNKSRAQVPARLRRFT